MVSYKSNLSEVMSKLAHRIATLKETSQLQRTVGSYLLASNVRRIHTEGISVSGSGIGNYNSTDPLYVNPKSSPKKFKPSGNPEKPKNVKDRKTKYFKSYKAFRQAVGAESSFVNLELTHRLRKDWALGKEGNDWVLGFKSKKEGLIARGNELRFRKRIWGVTQRDRDEIKVITEDFVNKVIRDGMDNYLRPIE
jgi:hypothetical protein